jgi:SRSO17 transposase
VVADETADEKRGKHTAGVSHQYAGCAGGIVNCVTWVTMSLIGAHGKTHGIAEMVLYARVRRRVHECRI